MYQTIYAVGKKVLAFNNDNRLEETDEIQMLYYTLSLEDVETWIENNNIGIGHTYIYKLKLPIEGIIIDTSLFHG